jgi:hypothetical protein
MRSIVMTFTTACALAACATTPAPTAKTAVVPASRIVDATYLTPDATRKAIVIVKRDTARFGLNCDNALFVDGHRVALIEPSERVELYLTPVEHVLSVSKPTCHGETRELAVTPSESVTKTFRIWSDQDGQLQFQPTAF